MSDADVHELVGFLAAFDPQGLHALQTRHPGEPLLQPGRPLGRLASPMRLRVTLASKALQAMVQRGDALADRLAQRLRSSHRVEFLAQLVALLGSGGALVVLLAPAGDERLKLSGAALGLLGSATALAVKYMRRDLGGSDNGLVAQHTALVHAVAQGIQAAGRLQAYERTGHDFDDPVELNQLLNEANTLAAQVYRLMKQAGVPVAALASGGVA